MKLSGLENAPKYVVDYCDESSAKYLNELLEDTITKHPEYLRYFIPILDKTTEISNDLRDRVFRELKNQILKTRLDTIPNELQFKIFESLDISDLRNLSRLTDDLRYVAEESKLKRLIASKGRILDLNLQKDDLTNFLDFAGHSITTLRFEKAAMKDMDTTVAIIGKCPELKTLVIKDSSIDAKKQAPSLGELKALIHLNLCGNNLRAKGAQHLAPSLSKLRNLTSLSLSDNDLGALGAQLLAPSLGELKALTHLDLTCNDFKAAGAAQLAPSLARLTAITYLNLSENDVEAEGAAHLAASLGDLQALTYLDLAENDFDTEGARQLAPTLARLTALTFLDLSDNDLEAAGAEQLVPSLVKLTALETLHLGSNCLGGEEAELLRTNLPCLRYSFF